MPVKAYFYCKKTSNMRNDCYAFKNKQKRKDYDTKNNANNTSDGEGEATLSVACTIFFGANT